jgi:hypothetical protein
MKIRRMEQSECRTAKLDRALRQRGGWNSLSVEHLGEWSNVGVGQLEGGAMWG